MSDIERCIDIDVPLDTAYNQWTQFEQAQQKESGAWRGEIGPPPSGGAG